MAAQLHRLLSFDLGSTDADAPAEAADATAAAEHGYDVLVSSCGQHRLPEGQWVLWVARLLPPGLLLLDFAMHAGLRPPAQGIQSARCMSTCLAALPTCLPPAGAHRAGAWPGCG